MPTGSHGAFREYQIDAITLQVRSRASLDLEFARSAILLKGGRLVVSLRFFKIAFSFLT